MRDYTKYKIAVIGDVMLDIWHRGTIERMSAEADTPILLNPPSSVSLGGAGNLAANFASLGAPCVAFGVLGREHMPVIGHQFSEYRISDRLVLSTDRPTTTKQRFCTDHRQLLRVDTERTEDIEPDTVSKLVSGVKSVIADCDAIAFADYDKGVCTVDLIHQVMKLAGENDVPVVVDPKYKNFWHYEAAAVFKPNLAEFRAAFGLDVDLDDAWPVECIEKLGVENLVVTGGPQGIRVCTLDRSVGFDAHKVELADVTGAGDTVMSVLSLEYLRTGDIFQAAALANYAGSLAVRHNGTYQVTVGDLEGFGEVSN